ncbi:MAG: DASH complex subunit ask1 [Icmadophila ericetorum]|nr:DASH complex subunit ask1 [Icmadophila ericetorum]
MAAQRNLSLTEELEKLEQSITLTLQGLEIDHNFNRAHRIVTTSIIPVVQNYERHSKTVWQGSKFWKEFFEASANVSLSGYAEEDTAAEGETVTEDTTSEPTPTSPSYISSNQPDPSDYTPISRRNGAVESLLDTTPRPRRDWPPPSIAAYSSPYEALRAEVQGRRGAEEGSTLPSTPRGQTFSESTPQSSPFLPPSTARHRTPANDVLLHRVLDKNYRLQATPHSQTRLHANTSRIPPRTPLTNSKTNTQPTDDSDLDSSPLAAPVLRREIFGSPAKTSRIPGVSVLTPAKNKTPGKGRLQSNGNGNEIGGDAGGGKGGVWDRDSDEEDSDGEFMGGMSPPKTIQFHIPQSRLLKTPAREASKRIVEDLLLTAGGNITDDLDESPSIVKRGGMYDEDTF